MSRSYHPSSFPHDHNPPEESITPIQAIHEPHTYQMGFVTFIQGGLLQDLIIPSISHPPHGGLGSCFINNTYPIGKQMCQSMNYKSKGLGLHEKGILEPLYIQENPYYHGLGYTPHSEDIGTHCKSSFHQNKPRYPSPSNLPSILSSYPSPSNLPYILGPYHPNPSSSTLPSILGPYIPPSPIHQEQQRHTSLMPSQNSTYINPSIIPPYHSSPSTYPISLGRNLGAKCQKLPYQNPHISKDQHVSSKGHAKIKENLI